MQTSVKPLVVPKAQEGLVAGQGQLEDVHSDGLGVDNVPVKAVQVAGHIVENGLVPAKQGQVAGQGHVEDFYRDGHDDVGGLVSKFVPSTNSHGVRFTR